jgi:hypothetical protein
MKYLFLFFMLFSISLTAQHQLQGIRHQFDFGKEIIDTVDISIDFNHIQNTVIINGKMYSPRKAWEQNNLKILELEPILGGPKLDMISDFDVNFFIQDQNKNYIKIILDEPAPTIIRL